MCDISASPRYTTVFLLYPPISANLDFDIYFKQRPKLSEQSLPHQWRFIYNWNNLRLQNVQNSESESQKVKVATFTRKWKWPLSPRNTWRIYYEECDQLESMMQIHLSTAVGHVTDPLVRASSSKYQSNPMMLKIVCNDSNASFSSSEWTIHCLNWWISSVTLSPSCKV